MPKRAEAKPADGRSPALAVALAVAVAVRAPAAKAQKRVAQRAAAADRGGAVTTNASRWSERVDAFVAEMAAESPVSISVNLSLGPSLGWAGDVMTYVQFDGEGVDPALRTERSETAIVESLDATAIRSMVNIAAYLGRSASKPRFVVNFTLDGRSGSAGFNCPQAYALPIGSRAHAAAVRCAATLEKAWRELNRDRRVRTLNMSWAGVEGDALMTLADDRRPPRTAAEYDLATAAFLPHLRRVYLAAAATPDRAEALYTNAVASVAAHRIHYAPQMAPPSAAAAAAIA
jgi:hypothetical protein